MLLSFVYKLITEEKTQDDFTNETIDSNVSLCRVNTKTNQCKDKLDLIASLITLEGVAKKNNAIETDFISITFQVTKPNNEPRLMKSKSRRLKLKDKNASGGNKKNHAMLKKHYRDNNSSAKPTKDSEILAAFSSHGLCSPHVKEVKITEIILEKDDGKKTTFSLKPNDDKETVLDIKCGRNNLITIRDLLLKDDNKAAKIRINGSSDISFNKTIQPDALI